jgi:hypothetical protein
MSIDSSGARITRRDVQELAIASEQLAVAADTIRGMGPKWGEAVVNLLIAVNLTITRLQNKGAAAFARYLEKHGTQSPVDASGAPAAAEDTPERRNVSSDKEGA